MVPSRANLVRPAFLGMLRDILRFNRETTRMAREGTMPALALGDYLAIATLGCKVNQYESAAMAECLTGAGYRLVDFHAAADCYIINTCTVTNGADYQSRQLIRRAQRLNPQAAIIVTGCYAQTTPHVFAGMPGVAVVAGMGEKNRMGNKLKWYGLDVALFFMMVCLVL